MAFSAFGNPGGGVMGGVGGNIQSGPDLEDIQTEALGFLALSGEAKVQLLPSPWPADSLPPPSASLMSIASNKGLLAAAGPDYLIVARTESIRKAFEGLSHGDGNFKPFQAELKIPMPMRISQLAFSADESYLVLAAQVGGGLAVYEVQSLLNGSSDMAFQLSTNAQALRALVPNPTAEKGELFAVVTVDGNLMMANLKERSFVTGPGGQVLKDSVSCLSWSAKGKQLVAGLGNGTAFQMTPEGEPKGDIPKPPGMDSSYHISSITWIENHVFLMIYTPSNFDPDMAPSSVFNIVTRQLPANFQFQKISEPVGPFGLNRSPPHHFLLRLRDFPPNLQDVLLVASTASTDIGLFSRSKAPLAKDKPVGVFTMTELSDDSRRAQLPLTAEFNDTSPIGFALDLSSKDKVLRPIPKDEIDESPTPLPALMVLNNDGVLASWWFVYTDSIRQGTIYPNLAITGSAPPTSSAPTQSLAAPLIESSKSSFGMPSNSGQVSAFGSTPSIGQRQSPWGAPSAVSTGAVNSIGFGKPAFGTAAAPSAPSFGNPTFGTTSTPAFGASGFAAKSSPWGTGSPSNPAFGQATTISKPTATFGSAAPSTGTMAPSSGGFASFASHGGFATAANSSSASIFGAKPATNTFGGSNLPPVNNLTPFGGVEKRSEGSAGIFGGASNPFVLGSTFEADGSAKDDAVLPLGDKTSMFGSGFGLSLGEPNKQPTPEIAVSKDADMDTADDISKPDAPAHPTSTTPAPTPAPAKSPFLATGMTGNSSIFGSGSPATSVSISQPSTTTSFGFGKTATQGLGTGNFSFANLGSTPANELVASPITKTPLPQSLTSPTIKEEQPVEIENARLTNRIPEAPLPPDPTSKTVFSAGDTSVSSTETEALLPPDVPKSKSEPQQASNSPQTNAPTSSISADLIPPIDVPGGPEDDGDDSGFSGEEGEESEVVEGSEEVESRSEDDEGSGEDVAQDISPTSEANQTPALTPKSSFGGFNPRETDRTHFTKIDMPTQSVQPRGSLFGEIERSAPYLPAPNLQSSPRSPSPVRSAIPGRMRSEAPRSVSAPGIASGMLAIPKAHHQSAFARQLEEQKAQEKIKTDKRNRKEAEEKQTLVDEQDNRLQKMISSDLVSNKTLDEFLARVEVNGKTSADSIPAQVETVYRDINSMVDTLGVNARALKCFAKGHTELYKEGGRAKDDLEDAEEWCLVEIDDLSSIIEKDLARELEHGRVREVARKLEICNDLQKDLVWLHARHDDIKKILASYSDPGHIAMARAQPLSAEQAAQQHDLRRNFTAFQKLLADAEEGLTVLKSKIVSQATSNGGSSGAAGPTVEAVMRTITKMTSMAEKRSGDIDVLEGQMRRLRFGSTASVGSREGSPFTTPSNRASLRNPGTSSTFGLFYTPDSGKDERRGFHASFMSSNGTFGQSSPPRKTMSGYSPDEKLQLKAKLVRKKEVANRLKLALQNAGTKVRLMDDNE